MDILFANAILVTMDEELRMLPTAYLGVTEGKISYIGKQPPKEQPGQIIDASGMALMPGLINCHAHLAGSLFRGYADGWNEENRRWLYQAEEKLDGKSVKAATLLYLAECLRFGVTSVSDLYYFTDEVAEAVAESGIKANLARCATLFDPEEEEFDVENDPGCAELYRLTEKWHGYDNGRIRIDAGILSPATSNFHLWEAMAGYAGEKELGFQLHLTENPQEAADCEERYGLRPAELLDCHGAFKAGATVAGLSGLQKEDMALLARRGATAVACPLAEANLGQSAPDVLEMAKAGLNVALGTGSPAEGAMDLFAVMRAAVQKSRLLSGDCMALPAPAALMLATVCGAKAQHRQKQCGMLKVGMDADVILVDFTAPHLMPCHNVLTSLVHSASGSDVALTMVQGKILYQSGKFTTIHLENVVHGLSEHALPRIFGQEKGKETES